MWMLQRHYLCWKTRQTKAEYSCQCGRGLWHPQHAVQIVVVVVVVAVTAFADAVVAIVSVAVVGTAAAFAAAVGASVVDMIVADG